MENQVLINGEKQDVVIRPVYSGIFLNIWNLTDTENLQINEQGPHFRIPLTSEKFLKYFEPDGTLHTLGKNDGQRLGTIDEVSGRLACEDGAIDRDIGLISFCVKVTEENVVAEICGETLDPKDYKTEVQKALCTKQTFKIMFSINRSNLGALFFGDDVTKNKYESLING